MSNEKELSVLKSFRMTVRESLKMAMLAYSKDDEFYVKEVIEELIKLEKGLDI